MSQHYVTEQRDMWDTVVTMENNSADFTGIMLMKITGSFTADWGQASFIQQKVSEKKE